MKNLVNFNFSPIGGTKDAKGNPVVGCFASVGNFSVPYTVGNIEQIYNGKYIACSYIFLRNLGSAKENSSQSFENEGDAQHYICQRAVELINKYYPDKF